MSRGTILFRRARPHTVFLLESNYSSTYDFVPFLRGSQEDPATVGEVRLVLHKVPVTSSGVEELRSTVQWVGTSSSGATNH